MVKKILSLIMVMLISVSVLAACGATGKADKAQSGTASEAKAASVNNADKLEVKFSEAMSDANKLTTTSNDGNKKEAEAPKGSNEATAVIGNGTAGQTAPNPILSQRKVIRNANVVVEVENFETAYSKIKTLIAAHGFVQESNIKKEKVYVGAEVKLLTKGIIIIRVDKDRFESVLSDVKGLGLLLDEIIKSDDVTDKFFDTESQLRQLKFEQGRLEQYLLKLTDPDAIFKTEGRLTQIRQDIEKLTGTLQKWNDLVELSTITINMSEKRPEGADVQTKEKSYWQRLTGGFGDSFKGVITFFGELLIIIVQALPVLIILGILAVISLKVYRKYVRNRIASKKDKDNDQGM